MTDRILNTILKFTLNKETLDKVKSGATSIEKAFEETNKRIEKTKQAMNQLRESSEKLTQIGMMGAAAGAAMTAPIILAARSYANFAGMTEKTSRAWLENTSKLTQAQMRLGRVGADAILPYMEKAVALAEKAAKYIEQNPDALKAILGTGVAITLVSGLVMAVSKGIRLYADVKALGLAAQQMLAAKIMQDAANKQLAAATGMAVGASGASKVGGAAVTGSVLGGFMAQLKALWNTPIGGATSMNARLAMATGAAPTTAASMLAALGPVVAVVGAIILAVVAAGILDKVIATQKIKGNPAESQRELDILRSYQSGGKLGGQDLVDFRKYTLGMTPAAAGGRGSIGLQPTLSERVDARIKQLDSVLNDLGDTAGKTADNLAVSTQAVQRYIQFRQEEKNAELQYGQQRNQIVENAGKQRAMIEENSEAQRTSIVESAAKQQAQAQADFTFSQVRQARDFAKSEAQAETDYYAQRSELAKTSSKELQRMEEDHQRAMRQLRLDHEYRMEDLSASRDALGMAREMRSYERQRKEAESSYKIELSRRKEDEAKTLADMEESFAKARDQRLADYEQTQADQKEDFDRQQEAQKKAVEEQLKQLEDAKRKELAALKKATSDELAMLKTEYDKQKAARRTALADEARLSTEAYTTMTADTKKFWDDMTAGWKSFYAGIGKEASNLPNYGSGTPAKAEGGYAGYGKYLLGERGSEYVMTAKTTQYAERMIGGRLSQEKLLAAMVSGSSGGSRAGRLTLNQNFAFHGSFTDADKEWFKRTARAESESVFLDVIGEA